ncbi:hypothetical protein [Stieleria mannarensis]|uniref:hypothetical protein n=1 Tax=Stieleria mannarensis TaxID=2755585 RepID=UPI001603E854|nr:hypothetical protein [Rhodopirellula sp. JC639]
MIHSGLLAPNRAFRQQQDHRPKIDSNEHVQLMICEACTLNVAPNVAPGWL